MRQYKYPVRHIFATGSQIFSRDILKRKMDHFDGTIGIEPRLLGETGLDGILIDFNYGLRLQIPEGNWHVRIVDAESEYIFFDDDISAVTLISVEKYFIEWEIAIWLDGEPVFYHRFDPRGQHVHFRFPHATLGDNLTLFPYAEAFRQKFECEVSCSVQEPLRDIVRNYYPELRLSWTAPEETYACYYMTMAINLPFASTEDGLLIPLRRIGHALLRRIDVPPKKIFTPTKSRTIDQKYVCIGVQASHNSKGWLAPDGWNQVIDYLKSLGYRVLCIDKERRRQNYGLTIEMPRDVEDMSGDYTLSERINQLAYADFFIGISSGLSWLAWAVDIPVILISGITARWHEFDTPYRINNPLVCHGCLNECRSLNKVWTCPLFKDTARAYECSKKISARQVINAIDRLIADQKQSGGAS